MLMDEVSSLKQQKQKQTYSINQSMIENPSKNLENMLIENIKSLEK